MPQKRRKPTLIEIRDILIASYSYCIEQEQGRFVTDGRDEIVEVYEMMKTEVQQLFLKNKRNKLIKKFNQQMNYSLKKNYLQFEQYINEKIGYKLDLLAEVKKHVDKIMQQGKINNENEFDHAGILLDNLMEDGNSEKTNQLKKLRKDYLENNLVASHAAKRYSKAVNIREKNGNVQELHVTIVGGPSPRHHEIRKTISPDENRFVIVQELGHNKKARNNSTTSVQVHLEKSNGLIYSVSGIHSDINAFWKDNNTIIIETRKEYAALTRVKHRQVQSFDNTINIEYIEQ